MMEYVSLAGFQETLNGLSVFAGNDEEVEAILDEAYQKFAKLAEKRRDEARGGSTYGVDDY
jgi:hypothetical protein